MNLSLLLPGLGQVYCGVIRRGLLQFSVLAALLVFAIVLLAMRAAPPMSLLLTVVILSLIPTLNEGQKILVCKDSRHIGPVPMIALVVKVVHAREGNGEKLEAPVLGPVSSRSRLNPAAQVLKKRLGQCVSWEATFQPSCECS